MARRLRIRPASVPLRGHCRPPGDKSVSHRVAILGGLAEGVTRIRGFLDAEDTRATLDAMAALGAEVEEVGDAITIGGGRLKPPEQALDLGNSGTGMRLLCGMLAGHRDLRESEITLVGDASLSSRPMGRIIDPLMTMGAVIESAQQRAPLRIRPQALEAIRYSTPVASAQVKSALLLAGLSAEGETVVVEPGPSRDHTERLLPAFGVPLLDGAPGVGVRGGSRLKGASIHVPGDLSSAAFLLAAAVLVPGSEVEIENVGLNPTRDGFLRVLDALGARLELSLDKSVGLEPVGTLCARHQSLEGIAIPASWVPLAIDEFPIIMALAASARGQSTIQGAQELRVKESDRIAVMCTALRSLGVRVDETPDGAVIEGGAIQGGTVDSHGDHRIAMSAAVLGLIAQDEIIVEQAEWIATSYPGFVDDLKGLGADAAWLD